MLTQIIPLERWEDFFAELSQQYQGMLSTIETLPVNLNPDVLAVDQPFDRICLEHEGQASRVSIMVDGSEAHSISGPLRIRTSPFASGAGQIIAIEAVGAPLTRVYLAAGGHSSAGQGGIFAGHETTRAERAVGAHNIARDSADQG